MSDLYEDHAELYEAAFDWDRAAEVEFLFAFMPPYERIMEPMCGPAYLLERFAARGRATLGIDTSHAMLELARRRFERAGLAGEWVEAGVAEFSIDEPCGGAVCPVNSVALLLTVAAMGRHLACMGRALRHGGAYLLQLDLNTPEDVRRRVGAATEHGRWEFEYRGETVQVEWFSREVDERFDTQVSRFTFANGNRIEHVHRMKLWSWEAWSALIEVSPFRLEAAFSGDDGRYATLPLDARLNGRPLTWHYLTHR